MVSNLADRSRESRLGGEYIAMLELPQINDNLQLRQECTFFPLPPPIVILSTATALSAIISFVPYAVDFGRC
jgi:hypothetical protein